MKTHLKIALFLLILGLTNVTSFTVGWNLGLESGEPTVIETTEISITPTESVINEQELFELVQSWRSKNDLQPYTRSIKLCDFAEERLEEIKTDYSHAGLYRWKTITYLSEFETLGENLGEGWNNEKKVLDAWLNSPTHKVNLLYDFTHSCIVSDKDHVVQIFGHY